MDFYNIRWRCAGNQTHGGGVVLMYKAKPDIMHKTLRPLHERVGYATLTWVALSGHKAGTLKWPSTPVPMGSRVYPVVYKLINSLPLLEEWE